MGGSYLLNAGLGAEGLDVRSVCILPWWNWRRWGRRSWEGSGLVSLYIGGNLGWSGLDWMMELREVDGRGEEIHTILRSRACSVDGGG